MKGKQSGVLKFKDNLIKVLYGNNKKIFKSIYHYIYLICVIDDVAGGTNMFHRLQRGMELWRYDSSIGNICCSIRHSGNQSYWQTGIVRVFDYSCIVCTAELFTDICDFLMINIEWIVANH